MDNLMHNLIKLKFIKEGYLPNYPYHLISDSEMCDAFLSDDTSKPNYFYDNYPCLDSSLSDAYEELVNSLKYHLNCLKSSSEAQYKLPDWVYAYMIGSVVTVDSPELDRHDLFVLMNMDNVDDTFTAQISSKCYDISKQWLSKLPNSKKDHRAPTMFGEPHIIKHLRLLNVGV